jgi:hypothetical protein
MLEMLRECNIGNPKNFVAQMCLAYVFRFAKASATGF